MKPEDIEKLKAENAEMRRLLEMVGEDAEGAEYPKGGMGREWNTTFNTYHRGNALATLIQPPEIMKKLANYSKEKAKRENLP